MFWEYLDSTEQTEVNQTGEGVKSRSKFGIP